MPISLAQADRSPLRSGVGGWYRRRRSIQKRGASKMGDAIVPITSRLPGRLYRRDRPERRKGFRCSQNRPRICGDCRSGRGGEGRITALPSA